MAIFHKPHPHSPSEEMTQEKFKEWLLRFDKNGDGRISRNELRNAIRCCGVWFSGWHANRAIKAADINHNGVIDDGEIDKLVGFARNAMGLKIATY